uniref:receptor protein-tyrosine kinase n=1 Tax=Strigamia maritima TaxID=126957 RepID=T1II99_STRMM
MTAWDLDRDVHRHTRWLLFIGCCAVIYVTFWMPGCYGAQREKELEFVKGGRICIGTNGRMSVPSNREHHYRNLRDRYTNCTYVDGNLELTWLQDENLELSFLQDIREVTGYVLISHVDVKRIVLPSLQIIRGRTLFKLSVHDEEFALMVTLSKMNNLEMPVLRGPPCDPNCPEGCWGEGVENCQKFSKINCSPQCHQGRCFGNRPRECCHLFCAGGCKGPKQSDCLACRNFYDDGVCKQECPQMVKYNPITYSWEINPDGKYAYGATCVKNCPEHLLKDSGACVRACPTNKKAVNGECKACDGPCPKTCKSLDQAVHSGNIDLYKDCTIIEGSLMILESSFQGFQHIYPNFTFGPRFNKMHPDKLEVFSTLKEVTGYINIQASHPAFRNLSYFRNLAVIGGRELTEYFSALYIVKTTLQSLELRSLESIRSGSVAILENKDLCFAEELNWRKLMKSEQQILLQNNKPSNECRALNLVCHQQCSKEGCWGIGTNECLSCANYKLDDSCIESCNFSKGLYDSGKKICEHCHKECQQTCRGPGPANCTVCKHVVDGPNCLAECPALKYNNATGFCLPCDINCADGCTGPGKFIGEGGCNSCERAIIRGRDPNTMLVECLNDTPTCPDGYYSDTVSPQQTGILEPLRLKSVCRQCHKRCKRCTGFGFHFSVCKECAQYKYNEHCEDSCPSETYADNLTRECLPCSPECRGCSGPGPTHCDICKNYKIIIGNNSSQFNCTTTCPNDMRYKHYSSEEDVPLCSSIEPESSIGKKKEETQYLPILLGVLGCIVLVGLFLALLGYQCWQRAKSKENTVKMTMRMTGYESDEPLKPSNVKPNLAKLHIVKEAELRKGGILGYGAFGTVYKGVWVPEDMDIDDELLQNGHPVFVLNKDDVKIQLPNVDEDDYLMPSVTTNPNASTYMDLIGDTKLPEVPVNGNHLQYDPRFKAATRNAIAMDNPEYHIMNNGLTDPTMNGRPRRTPSEDDSDHEYYNDYERLQKELQPLNHKRNETTV